MSTCNGPVRWPRGSALPLSGSGSGRPRPWVVGRFQSIPDEVHEDVAAKEGFTVVRRCTGGGAMFIEPGNTITYSLYAPRWFAADLDIEESYRLCDMC